MMYQEFAEIYDKFMEEADYDYLLNYLKKLVNFENINEILDLGCGTGELTKRLLKEAGLPIAKFIVKHFHERK